MHAINKVQNSLEKSATRGHPLHANPEEMILEFIL